MIEMPEEELSRSLRTNDIRGTWSKNIAAFFRKNGFELAEHQDSTIVELKRHLKEHYTIIVLYYCPKEKLDHYSIIRKIDSKSIYFLDPYFGKEHRLTIGNFLTYWKSNVKFENKVRYFLAAKKQ